MCLSLGQTSEKNSSEFCRKFRENIERVAFFAEFVHIVCRPLTFNLLGQWNCFFCTCARARLLMRMTEISAEEIFSTAKKLKIIEKYHFSECQYYFIAVYRARWTWFVYHRFPIDLMFVVFFDYFSAELRPRFLRKNSCFSALLSLLGLANALVGLNHW